MGPAPWVTIWTQPRATIRFLVQQDLRVSVLVLGALQGIEFLLYCAYFASLGRELPTSLIVTSVISVGPILGIFTLYLWAALLSWMGRLLGGGASPSDCRVALAWSRVPMTLSLGMWVLLLMASPAYPFQFASHDATSIFVFAICAIATLWSLGLLVGGVREVQGISPVLSILNISASAISVIIIYSVLNIIRN